VNYIVLGGALMMLLFSLLDYVTVPQLFNTFLHYRVAAAIIGVSLFCVNWYDKNNVYCFWIGFTGFVSVIFTMLLIIQQVGGVFSPYYVGLIVAIALYVTLAPLTVFQALMAGGVLVGGYVVTIAFSQPLAPPYLINLFSHLFFMVCFVLILATQSWADTVARRSEYMLRKEEGATTGKLETQAEKLETEVEKRTIEQDALEERYRQLFNQLADDVVVIDPFGEIVQSNKSFQSHFSSTVDARVKSFWNIVPEKDRPHLENVLRDLVATGTSLADGKMTMVRGDGTRVDVEVNGSVVTRRDVPQKILLIMRDLSTRKEIELQLIISLEMKKKTDTSAILVLAKLSEFRDVTPHNHLERIREYCKALAQALSQSSGFKNVMTPTYIEDIYHASILHDIGKVAIPDEYMAGDAPRAEYEKDLIRRHTLIGGDVIREMKKRVRGAAFCPWPSILPIFTTSGGMVRAIRMGYQKGKVLLLQGLWPSLMPMKI
jgi:PAS domain S-box-containing protein